MKLQLGSLATFQQLITSESLQKWPCDSHTERHQ